MKACTNSRTVLNIERIEMDREAALFRELGLRRQPSRFHFTSKTKWFGYLLLIGSLLFGFIFFYAAIFSKLLPDTGIYVLDVIKYDYYFCYLIPLSIIPTYAVIYLNWLSMNHFVQN